jgi:hypothetical protein
VPCLRRVYAASDHLGTVNAFEQWSLAEMSRSGRSFSDENFLSGSTLKTIQGLRLQLARGLSEIGGVVAANLRGPPVCHADEAIKVGPKILLSFRVVWVMCEEAEVRNYTTLVKGPHEYIIHRGVGDV